MCCIFENSRVIPSKMEWIDFPERNFDIKLLVCICRCFRFKTQNDVKILNTLLCSSSPDIGLNLDSISVSLQTSGIIFAVRSRRSLCPMDIKSTFLQLILCWTSNLPPQGQVVRRLVISQPYRSLIESQNWVLNSSNWNSVTGSTVNQFETPV